MVNYFTALDKNYIKKTVCGDFEKVEQDQEFFTEILRKVSETLKKKDIRDKDEAISTADKISSKAKEMREDYFSSQNEDKKTKLLIDNNAFED